MTNDALIEITARLSDAQELIARGSLQDAVALLNDTKTALWHKVHQATEPTLTFDEWLEKNNLFFSTNSALCRDAWKIIGTPAASRKIATEYVDDLIVQLQRYRDELAKT